MGKSQTGADIGNRRLAGDIKFYRGVGLHVRDARAAPDIAAMVPFYGDTFGLALPDQVSPELRGAGVGADMAGLGKYYENDDYGYAPMFGYIVCQETRDYTEDIEQGLEASDLDFGEVCDAVFHTFELMAEDAAADPGAYATHFQRCHDYLADGLGEGFDQTASYTYTDPVGDSWEIEIRGDDEIASPAAAPDAKQSARRR